MIENVITQKDFTARVQSELADLLKSANAEYAEELQSLSIQFAGQYYQYLNGTAEADRKRAEDNIRHIRATLTHISARMGLDVTDRLIKICTTVLSIAAAAAIRAII